MSGDEGGRRDEGNVKGIDIQNLIYVAHSKSSGLMAFCA